MIQNAVNSLAIIRIFPDVVKAIERYDPQLGTEQYNKHPLIVMMLDKLTQLAHGYVDWENNGFSHAYAETKRMADEE